MSIYLFYQLATSGASTLRDDARGNQLLPTFVKRIPATSAVRMHETGPTSRVQKRVLERERSAERDYKSPGDVYVTAIRRSFAPTIGQKAAPPPPPRATTR
jgi:hypothetical protein